MSLSLLTCLVSAVPSQPTRVSLKPQKKPYNTTLHQGCLCTARYLRVAIVLRDSSGSVDDDWRALVLYLHVHVYTTCMYICAYV